MKVACLVLLACASVASASGWGYGGYGGYGGYHDDHDHHYHGGYKHEEYDPDEDHYDEEMSSEDAEDYRYPEYYGYWDNKPDNKCEEYVHHAKGKDVCKEKWEKKYMTEHYPDGGWYRHWMKPKRECKTSDCQYVITSGTTICMEMVELYKPYKRRGSECKTRGQMCSKKKKKVDEEDDDKKEEEGPTGVPEKMDKMSNDTGCACQTIWCVEQIKTVYKIGDKLREGRVRVKYPCDCDCRKSEMMEEAPPKA